MVRIARYTRRQVAVQGEGGGQWELPIRSRGTTESCDYVPPRIASPPISQCLNIASWPTTDILRLSLSRTLETTYHEMTAAVPRSSALTVPPSQNTAPVREFRCLFTHDVRRKQKRWHDGFLRYHTFNKRIMVYDDSRNFIGDTHWKAEGEVEVGEEVTLNGIVLVEISEAVGTTDTDLTPLFEKKRPNAQLERQSSQVPQPLSSARPNFGQTPSQSRHRPLSSILETPRGPYGKATLPAISPYQERVNKENEAERRSAKRQKMDGPATAGLSIQAAWANQQSLRQNASSRMLELNKPSTNTQKATSSDLERARIATASGVINISSDDDSDAAGLSSPVASPLRNDSTSGLILVNSRKEKHNNQKVVRAPMHEKPHQIIERTNEVARPETTEAERSGHEAKEKPSFLPAQRMRPLKMATGRSRGMLLCETINNSRRQTTNVDAVITRDCNNDSGQRSVAQAKRTGTLSGSAKLSNKTESHAASYSNTTVRNEPGPSKSVLAEIPISKSGKDPVQTAEEIIDDNTMDLTTTKLASRKGKEKQTEPTFDTLGEEDFASMIDETVSFNDEPREVTKASNARPIHPNTIRHFHRVLSDTAAGSKTPGNNTDLSLPANNPGHAGPAQRGQKRQFGRSISMFETSPAAIAKRQKAAIPVPPPPPFLPPVVENKDVGPWSTEAFDLMTWRPPDRDANGKKMDS